MFKICYMKNGDLEHTYIFNGEENRSEDSVTYFSTKIFIAICLNKISFFTKNIKKKKINKYLFKNL